MGNEEGVEKTACHSGGNVGYWQNQRIAKYDYQQSLLVEKKEEIQSSIVRIINYVCEKNQISAPEVLDVGCGPGTPLSLVAHILDQLPNTIVVGVDASEQMIEAANNNLKRKYGSRFEG